MAHRSQSPTQVQTHPTPRYILPTEKLENQMTHPIANILQGDPVSVNIARFLLQNRQAMDSARGIAAWWVGCDEIAVQSALDRLIACGVVNAHTFKSCTLYGLTQNTETRSWLEAWINGYQPPSKSGGTPSKKRTQPIPGSITVIPMPDQSNE